MMLLNTTLLRERFTITDNKNNKPVFVALGNRIALPLLSLNEEIKEHFVIRTHSMHTALFMADAIMREFYKRGPIIHRQKPINWQELWFDVTTDFERPHTPETWCAIYYKGRVIYKHGDYHPFLDIIEQCDIRNRQEYDRAIPMAQDIFKQAEKNVTIDYNVNVALVIGALENKLRCGLILRSPMNPSTFNLRVASYHDDPSLMPYHGLHIAGLFFEAIQLSITSGFDENKLHDQDHITNKNLLISRQRRISRLESMIDTYENIYDIQYRPEKPDFSQLKEDAKK